MGFFKVFAEKKIIIVLSALLLICLAAAEFLCVFLNASSPVGRTEMERAPLAGFLISSEGLSIEEACTPELLGAGIEMEAETMSAQVHTASVKATGNGRLMLRLFFILLWALVLCTACLRKSVNRSLAFCGDSSLCLVLRYIHNNDGKK